MAKAKSEPTEPNIPANFPPIDLTRYPESPASEPPAEPAAETPEPSESAEEVTPEPEPEDFVVGPLALNERVQLLRSATRLYIDTLERVIPSGNDSLLAAAIAKVESAAHTANRAING